MFLKNIESSLNVGTTDDFLECVIETGVRLIDLISAAAVLNTPISNNRVVHFMINRYEDLFLNYFKKDKYCIISDYREYALKMITMIKREYKFLNHISNPLIFLYCVENEGETGYFKSSNYIVENLILEDYIIQVEIGRKKCRF